MIPDKLHFVWLGDTIPWAYVFAVLSAAEKSGMGQVILHHSDTLKDTDAVRALVDAKGVTLASMNGPEWMASLTRHGLNGERLAEIYRQVENPVARSNMLRAAAVVDFGGIYLDLDTITTGSLEGLLSSRQFVGVEHIVWPHFVRSSKSPLLWSRSVALSLVRSAFRRVPEGYRGFSLVSGAYYLGVNGAILGGEPRSPFLCAYLDAMTQVPIDRLFKKHALGTHLLQEQVDLYRGTDLVVHPPEVFYPLPPEISEHWFRTQKRPVDLKHALHKDTVVAHWYASVRTKPVIPQIGPDYVRKNAKTQLYSALVAQTLPQYR